jgi:hypothetical protein
MDKELRLTSCNNGVENGLCYDLTGINPRLKVNINEYVFSTTEERNRLAIEIAKQFNSALSWKFLSAYRCQNYKHHHILLEGTKI